MRNPLEPIARYLRKRTLQADLIQLDREKQQALDDLRDMERMQREVIAKAHQREAEIRDELDLIAAEPTRGEWWRFGLFLAALVPTFAAALMVAA